MTIFLVRLSKNNIYLSIYTEKTGIHICSYLLGTQNYKVYPVTSIIQSLLEGRAFKAL